MKQRIGHLFVEVTRRCQFECSHCLRGDRENKDMPMQYVESLLRQVDDIGSITFTGGEPSLNPECLLEMLELCKRYRVDVGSFFVVTNGNRIPESFAVACLKWYAYCEDRENCGVECSNDYFHSVEGNHNVELLEGLSFFRLREPSFGPESYRNLIIDGNAEENMYDGEPPEDVNMQDIPYLEEADELYLNVHGDLVIGCSWSYRRQNDNVACHVDDFAKTCEEWRERHEICFA